MTLAQLLAEVERELVSLARKWHSALVQPLL
jgi:hypothetical protein